MNNSIDYVCPIARTVELVASATDVMSGHDDRDPQWMRAAPAATRCLEALGGGVAGLRIGVLDEGIRPVLCEPGVLADFQRACVVLGDAGADIGRVSVPLW